MAYYNAFRICGIARYYAMRFLWDGGKATPGYIAIFITCFAVCMVAGYFLGGLNFAIIISKKKFGVDVRDFGSGNAGATNMNRTFGKKAGFITLGGDIGKAIIACLIGYVLLGRLGAFVAGFFCMLGHMFPAKYKFKGGKGVSCAAAVILMTDIGNPSLYFIPIVFFIVLGCFIVIVAGTKFVSLGSIMSAFLYPLIFNAFEKYQVDSITGDEVINVVQNPVTATYLMDFSLYVIFTMTIMVMLVFMHRENIKRLLHGQESKLDFQKNKAKEKDK